MFENTQWWRWANCLVLQQTIVADYFRARFAEKYRQGQGFNSRLDINYYGESNKPCSYKGVYSKI